MPKIEPCMQSKHHPHCNNTQAKDFSLKSLATEEDTGEEEGESWGRVGSICPLSSPMAVTHT